MQRAVDVLFKNRSVDYDKVEIHFVQRNVRVGFRKDEKPVARDFGRKIIFRTVARQRYGFLRVRFSSTRAHATDGASVFTSYPFDEVSKKTYAVLPKVCTF